MGAIVVNGLGDSQVLLSWMFGEDWKVEGLWTGALVLINVRTVKDWTSYGGNS